MSKIDSYLLMTTEREGVNQLSRALAHRRGVYTHASTFNRVAQYAGGEIAMGEMWAYCANDQGPDDVTEEMRMIPWLWPDFVQLFWRNEGEIWKEVDWRSTAKNL